MQHLAIPLVVLNRPIILLRNFCFSILFAHLNSLLYLHQRTLEQEEKNENKQPVVALQIIELFGWLAWQALHRMAW